MNDRHSRERQAQDGHPRERKPRDGLPRDSRPRTVCSRDDRPRKRHPQDRQAQNRQSRHISSQRPPARYRRSTPEQPSRSQPRTQSSRAVPSLQERLRHNQPTRGPRIPREVVAKRGTLSFAFGLTSIIAVLLLLILLVVPHTCQQQASSESQVPATEAAFKNETETQGDTRAREGVVTFLAVGDNTPNDNIGSYADYLEGEVGDGSYNYAPIFQPVAERIRAADLAYVNEETCVGGNEIGPQGYPNFNTTDEMAHAIVDAGFDLVATANNHSYDFGRSGGLEHSVELWESLPVDFVGTATSPEQYERIVTRSCNGITFALLNYTYGLNGYEAVIPDGLVHLIDEDAIVADVARAREVSDVVLVAMHWGEEHQVEENEEQRQLAQLLADNNVDMVIGAHPHVIQAMEWVENSDGSGHRTLVTYSLGNFLIDHADPLPENVLEGMVTCDFVRGDEGEISIENIAWTPLVLHVNSEQTEFAVYAADDYSAELAAENRGLARIDKPMNWLYERTKEIVGAQWFS